MHQGLCCPEMCTQVENQRCKEYAVFDSPLAACAYAENIGEAATMRCWNTKLRLPFYFDLDRHDTMFEYIFSRTFLSCIQNLPQTDAKVWNMPHNSAMLAVSSKRQ
jgi:hypothetical protein